MRARLTLTMEFDLDSDDECGRVRDAVTTMVLAEVVRLDDDRAADRPRATVASGPAEASLQISEDGQAWHEVR